MNSMYPELDLDLTFHPVACPRPRRFTREQIDAYNERGYIAGVPLYDARQRAEIRDFFDRRRADLLSPGPFESFHHRIPELHDIVTNPRLTEYLQDLLGPNVICHVSQYIRKEPGAGPRVVWHQDASFNPMDSRCIIVWLAIDDATVENGCMWFIPGSHHLGGLDCTTAGNEVPDAERHGSPIPIELPAGHAVFFSDLLLHSSPANRTTDRPRGALTATYAAGELRPTLGRKTWSVLCSGEDPHGEWQIRPRP